MDAAEILREVTGIAAERGTLAGRAEALLAQLQRVGRFDAGWIAVLPADQDSNVPLARSGYDERVCGYLEARSGGVGRRAAALVRPCRGSLVAVGR